MRRHNLPRSTKGQGLAEAACGSIIMVMLFVLLTAFAVNGIYAATYSAKLQIIANESAKVLNSRTYWNGALRPLFQRTGSKQQQTKQTVQDYAFRLSQELGLPNAPVVTIPDQPDTSINGVAYNKVTVSSSSLPLPFAFTQIFPNFMSIQAVGIASEASEAPPGFIRLGYRLISPSSSNPSQTNATQVCIIPCYGFQTDTSSGSGGGNLGGTDNNGDVVANQPNANDCIWNGLNVDNHLDPDGQIRPHMMGTPPLINGNIPAFN